MWCLTASKSRPRIIHCYKFMADKIQFDAQIAEKIILRVLDNKMGFDLKDALPAAVADAVNKILGKKGEGYSPRWAAYYSRALKDSRKRLKKGEVTRVETVPVEPKQAERKGYITEEMIKDAERLRLESYNKLLDEAEEAEESKLENGQGEGRGKVL